MPDRVQGPVTQILAAIGPAGTGDKCNSAAGDQLMRLVYDELHAIARRQLSNDPAAWMMQTSSMVHEAYIRLVGSGEIQWKSKAHFFGAAAEAMRRILIERVREARTLKRGGGHRFEALDHQEVPHSTISTIDLVALSEALDNLQQRDPRKAEVVKLRFFAGLSVEDTALAMDVSERTVHREWMAARAWLHREMGLLGTLQDGQR